VYTTTNGLSVQIVTSVKQYLKFIFLAHKSQSSNELLNITWCLSSINLYGLLLKNHWAKLGCDALLMVDDLKFFLNLFLQNFWKEWNKFGPNSSWEIHFQNCVLWVCQLSQLIIHLLALSLVFDIWFTCNWYIELIF